MSLGGCVATSAPDTLDPRLAWPCDRLVVAWPVPASELQPLIGENVTQRSANGSGELHLSVMRCDRPGTAQSSAAPLMYAIVTVPISAESAPLVVTNIPEDGWWALSNVVSRATTNPLFLRMGYAVIAAEISFDVNATRTKTSLAVRLEFQDGHIYAVATVTGESAPHDATTALVESTADALSAFFGDEKAQRYSSVSATVESEGDTPLSQFKLPPTPAAAFFDRTLTSDRILWRQPISQK